ncbi:MAG: hypothetical protein K9G12_06305 [Candidatus Nanopelagicales bacterium]|nr:hypothetical protein [Candidatus Nanopelagicales bacterium]MCF8539876.1 hypothetical protein [Candidatus Nanopelagicales bacterium]
MNEVSESVDGEIGNTEDTAEVLVLDEVTDPELVLPVWEATGNPEVDGALELIQGIDPDDIHSHAEILGTVHGQLHDLMSQLDR